MTLQSDESTVTSSGLQRYVPYLVAGVAVSLLFLGWVVFANKSGSRTLASSVPSPASVKNAETVAYYGSQLKVLSFYANPEAVRPGGRALVCYGVSNAATVTIDPPVGNTWPSASRCLEVTAAKKDTEYKLTARDSGGHEETRTAVLRIAH